MPEQKVKTKANWIQYVTASISVLVFIGGLLGYFKGVVKYQDAMDYRVKKLEAADSVKVSKTSVLLTTKDIDDYKAANDKDIADIRSDVKDLQDLEKTDVKDLRDDFQQKNSKLWEKMGTKKDK